MTTRAAPMGLETPTTAAGLNAGFVVAGVLLGIGLGGFADGILLHQILQWHHMLTATGDHPMTTVGGLEDNTLWDGLFHSLTWVATALGLAVLWSSRPFSRSAGTGIALFGLMLLGWGLFNVVEGVIDHHILGIHHVRDDVEEPLPWDLGFLAFGAALIAGGAWLAKLGNERVEQDKRGLRSR